MFTHVLTIFIIGLPIIYCENHSRLWNTTMINNSSKINKTRMWSTILENLIVSHDDMENHREAKVLKFGDKSVNVLRQGSMMNKREVSETDLYLLGAIEKLVYKVDTLEDRLRRAEELLFYVISGNKTEPDPCPVNYNKIGSGCYHFSTREYDWKSAASLCRGVGGDLIEFETMEQKREIKAYLKGETKIKNRDYWTGGLNPGLLWIWASSAKPIDEDENDGISGTGRCLKFRYSPASKVYFFEGEECIKKLHYICQLTRKNSADKVKKIERNLGWNENG